MRVGQSRRHSAIEAILNILIGVGVAFLGNLVILPYYGFDVTFEQNIGITVFFTVISFIRSYFVRRLFNYLHLKEIL